MNMPVGIDDYAGSDYKECVHVDCTSVHIPRSLLEAVLVFRNFHVVAGEPDGELGILKTYFAL